MVPQTVAKIAICDYPMASGNYLVTLIAKLNMKFGYKRNDLVANLATIFS